MKTLTEIKNEIKNIKSQIAIQSQFTTRNNPEIQELRKQYNFRLNEKLNYGVD